MAKTTNGGKSKAPSGGTKARRAPARRKTDKKTAEAPVAVASELATPEQTAAPLAAPPSQSTELTESNDTVQLNPEEVRRRAFEIYCDRGCGEGSDVDDWLEAERQLRRKQLAH